jgi:hypothetical protein
MEDARPVRCCAEKLGLAGDAVPTSNYDPSSRKACEEIPGAPTECPVYRNVDAKTVKELNVPAARQVDRPWSCSHMSAALVPARSRPGAHVVSICRELHAQGEGECTTVCPGPGTTRQSVDRQNPTRRPPLLTEDDEVRLINPTWKRAPSIVYGEYLPALQQDPTVLEAHGPEAGQ